MSLIGKKVRFKDEDDDDKEVILEGEVVDKIRVPYYSGSNEDKYVISAKDDKKENPENEIFIVDPYDLLKIIKDLKE